MDRIRAKPVPTSSLKKIELHYQILHIWNCLDINFWIKFAQRRLSGLKENKVSIDIDFSIFEFGQIPYLSIDRQFWFLIPNLPQKDIFSLNQEKRTLLSKSGNSNVSLQTKFHPKHTFWFFGTKFSQKGHFRSKIEKVNITIKLDLFDLDYNQSGISGTISEIQ